MSLPVEHSLRLLARTVFADRLTGDEFLQATLAEMRRRGETTFASSSEALRRFIENWREVAHSEPDGALFTNRYLLQAMGEPPDEQRLVLILADVLGLSLNEVEEVLAPLSAPASVLLDRARREIGSDLDARAVVIEDEPMIAADLQELLEGLGVTVVGTARTADDAVAIVEKHRPDIILTDYSLEGEETGVDAIRRIREFDNFPVIFITAFPETVLKGSEVDPDFVIAKPFRPEAVRAAVSHCLDTQRPELVEAD